MLKRISSFSFGSSRRTDGTVLFPVWGQPPGGSSQGPCCERAPPPPPASGRGSTPPPKEGFPQAFCYSDPRPRENLLWYLASGSQEQERATEDHVLPGPPVHPCSRTPLVGYLRRRAL